MFRISTKNDEISREWSKKFCAADMSSNLVKCEALGEIFFFEIWPANKKVWPPLDYIHQGLTIVLFSSISQRVFHHIYCDIFDTPFSHTFMQQPHSPILPLHLSQGVTSFMDDPYVIIFSAVLKTPEDGEILLDFSKNRINEEVFALLVDLVSRA